LAANFSHLMFSGLVSGFAYQAPALPQFLPEPGVLAVKVGVQVEVLLEVLLHVLLGRQLPPHNNDHSLLEVGFGSMNQVPSRLRIICRSGVKRSGKHQKVSRCQ